MSNSEIDNLITFEVLVEGEHAGYIHLMPEAEALVAAMKSDPTIRFIPNERMV